jgi:nucleotide-binding universal stress UspA family protein
VDENSAAEPGVTVGVDGTTTALRAVGWATAEAGARGVPLKIVHAAPYAGSADGRRRAEEILAHACSTAHRCDNSVTVRTEILDGQPVPALVHASDEADLLVVGMADGHPGEVTLGSVAIAVTGRARCPVAVVRGHHRAAASGRPVLLGVDDVPADAPAVTAAFADAQRHGTPLVVLHARPGHAPGSDADVAAGLEDQLAPWRHAHPHVPTEVRIARGRPEDALLHAAAQARLVIVSTRRRGNLARLVLGSCSRALARHSPCPVTVVDGSHAGPSVGTGHESEGAVPVAPGAVPASAIDPHDPSQLW